MDHSAFGSREFERFVDEESARLLRLAHLLTGRQEDAEDLLQDSLIRIGRHWEKVRGAADVRAYARTVLTNEFIGKARKRRLRTVPWANECDGLASSRVSTDETIALRDELMRAVGRLPPRQRAIVILRYYEDLSTAEISDLLSLRESSVRSALARGMARLRGSFRTSDLRRSGAGT